MGLFAFLAPVGPFAGLSNGARQKIGELFPSLSLADVERAAESFLIELEAPALEPRLPEARNEMNIFAKELARFHAALNQLRKHRLDSAIGEASRMIGGEDEVENLERSMGNLRTAIQRTSRALPSGQAELASRRLIEALAERMREAGLPIDSAGENSLLGLVDLIFEDLMVGGDAASALKEWRHSHQADIDRERAAKLLELVR